MLVQYWETDCCFYCIQLRVFQCIFITNPVSNENLPLQDNKDLKETGKNDIKFIVLVLFYCPSENCVLSLSLHKNTTLMRLCKREQTNHSMCLSGWGHTDRQRERKRGGWGGFKGHWQVEAGVEDDTGLLIVWCGCLLSSLSIIQDDGASCPPMRGGVNLMWPVPSHQLQCDWVIITSWDGSSSRKAIVLTSNV